MTSNASTFLQTDIVRTISSTVALSGEDDLLSFDDHISDFYHEDNKNCDELLENSKLVLNQCPALRALLLHRATEQFSEKELYDMVPSDCDDSEPYIGADSLWQNFIGTIDIETWSKSPDVEESVGKHVQNIRDALSYKLTLEP